MKRILLLGATGMLGNAIKSVFSARNDISVDITQRQDSSLQLYLDASNAEKDLKKIIRQYEPYDCVINCIAVLKNAIDPNNIDMVKRAVVVNSLFPHQLAKSSYEVDTKVIQISTDGVFSGMSNTPYLEDSFPDSNCWYGKTKCLGEVIYPNFLNIRCSIIGRDSIKKQGLLEWFLEQPEGETVFGYNDSFWNGVTTLQFATLCLNIIDSGKFDKVRSESHLYHFCPNPTITKYDMLKKFKRLSGKDINLVSVKNGSQPIRFVLATKYSMLESIYTPDLSLDQELSMLMSYNPEEYLNFKKVEVKL